MQHILRHLAAVLIGASALISCTESSALAEQPASTVVRPFVSTGYSLLSSFGSLEHGNALGGGIETAVSPHVAVIAETQFQWLRPGARNGFIGGLLGIGDGVGGSGDIWSASLGLRCHPAATSRLRPYADASLGVRFGAVRETPGVYASAPSSGANSGSGSPHPGDRLNGPVGLVRLGLSSAGSGGTGFFVDAGYEVVLRNPRSYAIVPFRFGIMLP